VLEFSDFYHSEVGTLAWVECTFSAAK